MRRKITLLLALGAMVALLAGTSVQSAAAKTYPSSIKIKAYSLGFFSGKVKSPHKPCKKKRKVEVWHDSQSGSDSLAGEGRTNKKGKWELVDFHGLGGSYYAIVKQKTVKGDTCQVATSPPFVR
jgi:hypothetical protein